MAIEVKMWGAYREIYAVTECDVLFRRYGHFSRSIQLGVWGEEEAAVSLPAGSGQSRALFGVEGAKPLGVLKILHFAVPNRDQKRIFSAMRGVFLVPCVAYF